MLACVAAGAMAALSGCGEELSQGNVRVTVPLGPLGPRGEVGVEVAPLRDVRPAVEHEGQERRTKLFFTVGVVTHWQTAGNFVTDDFAATADAAGELRGVVAQTLRQARVARVVGAEQAPSFLLETDVLHLYATHHEMKSGTVVVMPSSRRSGVAGGGAGFSDRQYGNYGNVVLRARLTDRRTGQPVVVFDEHVVGVAQTAPRGDAVAAAQDALRAAVTDAVGTLAVRLGAALDRLGEGPNGPPFVLTDRLPPVFLIERVSRYRDFLETVFVDTPTGRVVRHEITPLVDRASARPGEWLLSRRTPEGVRLSGEGYEAYARALAARYDIRAYDDAYRYHFFGVRGVAPAPTSPPE